MQSFKEAFSRHLRHPSTGPVGWLVKHILVRTNRYLEKEAARLLGIQPHDRVLEVGFGPGLGLQYALEHIGGDGRGKVYRLEISPEMIHSATKRLHRHIASGKLHLTLGNVMNLPYPDNSMDRIFHVNCYYFWDDLDQGCKELNRVLSPGGAMITTMDYKTLKLSIKRDLNAYADKYDPYAYMKSLEQTGFTGVRMEHLKDGVKDFEAIFACKE
ncbi:uncharacterized methyltransferase YdaC-like [Branchiostoma floridae]|uniref:phosphoethanolamine N-methyltransferase n=1 Tax=Branchiostoma floridae TaxID=7739 RepID=A0A9J7KZW9_BRAFL|nr:uncharacterized methyltransferase YdaC-like [Branchiostoma floridae]